MPLEDSITLALIALNIVLTLVLAVIYFRNYRTISSRMTLGLVVFAIAFLAENALDFFFYNSLLEQGITGVTTFHLTVNFLQMVALLILVWVTWK
jgi:hypothetical protein